MAGFFEKLSGVAGSVGKLAGAVSPFVTAGIGIAQAFKGAKQAKQAREARQALMDNRQELRNITEGMRVSTLGAQMQTQEAQRRFASSVDALRSGGVRGLVGGLGQMEQQQQYQQQRISADLDRQQQQIEMMGAQDQARIRDMQESREEFEIGALAGEEASGRERMMQGIGLGLSGVKSMVPEAGDPRVKDVPLLGGAKQIGVDGLQYGVNNGRGGNTYLQGVSAFDFNKNYDLAKLGQLGQIGNDLSGLTKYVPVKDRP